MGGSYVISQMGLIKVQNERPVMLDGFDSGKDTADDTLTGGLIGSLIGILGGPLGVLWGGSMGALVGMAADAGDAVKNVSMLERVGAKMEDARRKLREEKSSERKQAVAEKRAKLQAEFAAFKQKLSVK